MIRRRVAHESECAARLEHVKPRQARRSQNEVSSEISTNISVEAKEPIERRRFDRGFVCATVAEVTAREAVVCEELQKTYVYTIYTFIHEYTKFVRVS